MRCAGGRRWGRPEALNRSAGPICARMGRRPPPALGRLRHSARLETDRAHHFGNCGGDLKIIAAILEAPVIENILTRLGLQAGTPPRAPARGQALQANCQFITVHVARRAGLRGSAARKGFRADGCGAAPRPGQTPCPGSSNPWWGGSNAKRRTGQHPEQGASQSLLPAADARVDAQWRLCRLSAQRPAEKGATPTASTASNANAHTP